MAQEHLALANAQMLRRATATPPFVPKFHVRISIDREKKA
jgi:hypothetical protein